MGVTSKGLRYPEGTVLANTLHTRIKELADDANVQINARDNRLTNLENAVDARGLPLTRNGSYTPTVTNMPNDNANRNLHLVQNIVNIPSTAITAHVSMQVAGHAVTNAQCHWNPEVSFNNGSTNWEKFTGGTFIPSHNNGNPALNIGFSVAGVFDVRGWRGQNIAVSVTGYNDINSGSWVHVGYLHYTVTIMS